MGNFPGITGLVQVAIEGFRGLEGCIEGDQCEQGQIAGNRQPGTDPGAGVAVMAGHDQGDKTGTDQRRNPPAITAEASRAIDTPM